MASQTSIPGVFVTGTDTGIGKTVVAGGIAAALKRRGVDVGVFKPVATGCRSDWRGNLISSDAEFLAACADTVDPLSRICPCAYAEPLSPHLAARRAGKPVDFDLIALCFRQLTASHGFVVAEGAGGLLTPVTDRKFIADIAAQLGLPLVIVTDPKLGTLTRTGAVIEAARSRKLPIAGVIVNRYDPDKADLAEETAAAEIERVFRVDVLASLPTDPGIDAEEGRPGKDILGLLGAVDWGARRGGAE
jgi:dethiobiotin synthetase